MTLSVESFVGRKLDHFVLDEFVANGAMGMVFKATDTILNRTVAIKLISTREPLDSQTLTEARLRLLSEARAAGRLSHPNVVGVYCYGQADDLQYICMEYVNGRTLGDLLSEKNILDVETALSIIERVLEALEAASREGIVHRDIKPSNIMITREGVVKVMDFGIAKLPSLSMTMTGAVLGTPFYMSPEQITGQKVDIRSDIFAVGVVLYQMVTGARAFEGEGTASLAYKIVNVDPTPPNVLNTHLPPELVGIIQKALAKDPVQRYQTPGEMLTDIRKVRTVEDSGSKVMETEATVISVVPPLQAQTAADMEAAARPMERTSGSAAEQVPDLEGSRERSRPVPSSAFGAEDDAAAVAAETVIGTPEEGIGPWKGTSSRIAEKASALAGSREEPRPVPPPEIPLKKEAVREEEERVPPAHPEGAHAGAAGEKKSGAGRMLAVGALILIFCILGIYAGVRMFQKPGRQDVTSLGRTEVTPPAEVGKHVEGNGAGQVTTSVKVPDTTTHAAVSTPVRSDGSAASSASALIAQAKGQMAGNPNAAKQLLEEALKIEPENLEGILLLAGILADMNDFTHAIQYYRQAIQINGGSSDVRFAMGSAYMRQGNYDEAVASFEAGRSLSADNRDDVLTSLGICYWKKGNTAKALSSFQRAIAINPDNAEAQRYLGSLRATPGQPTTAPVASLPNSNTGSAKQQSSHDSTSVQKVSSPSSTLPIGPAGGEKSDSSPAGSISIGSTTASDQAKSIQGMQTQSGFKGTEEVNIDLGSGQGPSSGLGSPAGQSAGGQ